MNALKVLFSIVFVAASVTVSHAQRGARIGYIDMEYILENVPEYQEAKNQLSSKVSKWKRDLNKMRQEIEQLKLNLSNERILLTKELIEEQEEEIKILEDEMIAYQQNRFGPNGDLDVQRRQLVQPIQDQVFNLVQELAEAKKYDFVFDKSADVVMLFAAKRNDISDQILRSINRAAKREEALSRKEGKNIEKEESLSAKESEAQSEREKAIADKKNQREAMMEERRRKRDSIRMVKQAEFEARRQELLDKRQRRLDSINGVQNNTGNEGSSGAQGPPSGPPVPPGGGDGSGI
ncbi:OmpH family outer membrane protein [Flavobacteriaceae bacterium]|nr:OmpH family outer membrane protein [Flavobacteriaceae bacterium]